MELIVFDRSPQKTLIEFEARIRRESDDSFKVIAHDNNRHYIAALYVEEQIVKQILIPATTSPADIQQILDEMSRESVAVIEDVKNNILLAYNTHPRAKTGII